MALIGLCLAPLAASAGGSGGGVGAGGVADVLAREARVEYFLLPDPTDPTGQPLGALRHVRLQREGADWQVEQEILLLGPEARLHTLERFRADRCQLIHREQVRGGGGWTLRASWPERGATPPVSAAERLREWEPRVVIWAGTQRREHSYVGARGWRGPSSLIERLRWGIQPEGQVARLEVLSGRPELVEVRSDRLPGFPGLRLASLVGPDGAGRGAALFAGTELLALGWQAGGAWAVRTDRDGWDRVAGRHPLVPEGVQGSVKPRPSGGAPGAGTSLADPVPAGR